MENYINKNSFSKKYDLEAIINTNLLGDMVPTMIDHCSKKVDTLDLELLSACVDKYKIAFQYGINQLQ